MLWLLFLLWILIGALTGWVTGRKMKGFGYGPLMDVAMGATGGVAVGFMVGSAQLLGQFGLIASLPASALGAAFLTGFVGFASGERRHA